MASSIHSYASNLIRFVVFWIILSSILVPLSILSLFPELASSVPVEIEDLFKAGIIEFVALASSYVIYSLIIKYFIKKPTNNLGNSLKFNSINLILLSISAIVVAIHSAGNIFSPASYSEINEIGSSSGFGGSLALATLYPLFVSIIIASATYILLADPGRYKYLLKILISILMATALSGVLSGGRMSILYPFMPYLLSTVIKFGMLGAIRKYASALLISIPFFGIFLIFGATLRVGGSIDEIGNSLEFVGLFFTHLYLKFSGITNSTFLGTNANVEDYGSVLTALSGSLTTYIPRFLFESKAISGSLNGLESGLPYRIAAHILGYEDYGNVVLSPAILAYWLAGPWGSIANIITISVELILIYIFFTRGLQFKSPIYIGIALYALGMPHFLAFYVDFTQGVSLVIRVIVIYFSLILLTNLLKRQQINLKLNQRR